MEAKSIEKSVGDGLQQAIEYADILDVPFAYSSNGSAFLERNILTGTEREISIDQFPTYDELWDQYRYQKGLTPA